jgi:hypothetical protein
VESLQDEKEQSASSDTRQRLLDIKVRNLEEDNSKLKSKVNLPNIENIENSFIVQKGYSSSR